MNENIKCFKCGTVEGTIIKHHIKYEPEIIVDCCQSCHKKIHNRVRKEGSCKYSIEETNELSHLSSNRRYNNKSHSQIVFDEVVTPQVSFQEHILYNINTGCVSYAAYFKANNGKKLWMEDI